MKEIISAIIKGPCDISSVVPLFRNRPKGERVSNKKLLLSSSFINKPPLEHFVSKKENKVRKIRGGETQPPRQINFQKKKIGTYATLAWFGLFIFPFSPHYLYNIKFLYLWKVF